MSEFEKIDIGTLDVNDGVNYTLEQLVFKPAEAKPQWAENADADGAALVQEPHYTNAYFELQIRVEPRADTDTALAAVGALLDAVQECARVEGGQEIPWTPNNSSRTLTWYALLGEVQEVPVTVTGELAGWFVESPVVKVKLTCRPFGYAEERVALAATSSTASLQVVYIEGIGGDVPAEATLRITDKATQDRRYVEWGQDLVESAEGNPAPQLKAGSGLTVEGYGGTLAFRSGAVSGLAVKVTLGSAPVVICSTGPIAHVGSFRLDLRSQSAKGALLRASYRVGDGPWTSLPWRSGRGLTTSVETVWRSIGLGEAFLEEAEKGEQVSEIRIEGKMEEGLASQTAYVDLMDLMPTRRYGVGHAPIRLITPKAFSVSDPYDQTEGNATGKEAAVGGVYAAITNSDTTDFTTAGGKLKRTAVSDSGTIGTAPFTGRAIGTATKFKDVALSIDYKVPAQAGGNSRWGALLSYVDNTHFVAATLYRDTIGGILCSVQTPSGTALATSGYLHNYSGSTMEAFLWCEGRLLIVVAGSTVTVYSESPYEPLNQVLKVEDALIGVEGKAAVYDQANAFSAGQREYDNLSIWVPEVPVVCEAGRALEIRENAEEREDAAATLWAPLPEYRGSHFLLDPAGEEERVNRVAAKLRRGDLTEDAEANMTDEQSIEVLARERFLAPR